jgi:hypothetical protein
MSMAEKMTDPLAQTVAQVLSSELADPEAIAALIRETEAELASLEAKQADAEARVLSPVTSDEEAEELSKSAAVLRLQCQRKAVLLDKLRACHASAVLRCAKAEAEERRRQVMAERDQVAKDLQDHYPALASELAALLARVSDSEARCKGVNLPGPEATVRNLGPGAIGHLARGVILPAWDPRQDGSWPPNRPRSQAPPLPAPVMERSAELGQMARATMEENLRQEGRRRGMGEISLEAELVPPSKAAH